MNRTIALALVFAISALLPARPSHAVRLARITYYTETGVVASGAWTYPGAAACSYDLPLGTVVRLATGDLFVCEDRGLLGDGTPSSWLDIWAPDGETWIEQTFGRYAEFEVLP